MQIRDLGKFSKRCAYFCNGDSCEGHAVKNVRFMRCLNDMIINRVWPVREILRLMENGSLVNNTEIIKMAVESLNELIEFAKYLKEVAERPFRSETACEARYLESVGTVVCGTKGRRWETAADILSLTETNEIRQKGFCAFCRSFKEATEQSNVRTNSVIKKVEVKHGKKGIL